MVASAKSLAIFCDGDDAPGPTVVLDVGLGGVSSDFTSLQAVLAPSVRVCIYDRAGTGASPALASDAPDPSPASSADLLYDALHEQGVTAPYVLLGASYGGLIVQSFAVRHPEDVAGLILSDTAVPEELVDPIFYDPRRPEEGGRFIDVSDIFRELGTIELGDVPTVVLTQGLPAPPDEQAVIDAFITAHERIAASGDNTIHLMAVKSPHDIHARAQTLVVAAVLEVVDAARNGTALVPCDERFAPYFGECR